MNGSVLFEGNPILSGSLNVNTGGNIKPLEVEINENGTRTITPPSGVDGYAPITIKTVVPQIVPILETLNVSQNGRYEPPEGVAGFDEVNVNVPIPTPTFNTINITANGTYTPPSGIDGYNEINVNVASTPDFYLNNQLFNYSGSRVDIPFIDNKTLQDGDRILVVLRDSVNYPTFANCFAGQMDEGLSISGTLRGGNSINGFVMNNLLRIQTLQGGSRNMYVNIIKLPDNYFNNMFT